MNNRKHNCKNIYQGDYKRVLCVCSAGLLRSPTAALVLSREPFNFNTRSVGLVTDFALIPLDNVLLEWADEIVCMDSAQAANLCRLTTKPVHNLNIDDNYPYRDAKLIALIAARCKLKFERALSVPTPEETMELQDTSE